MRLKRYEGRTMAEALRRVREELGADAVILRTYSPKRRGLWRLLGGGKFAILAGKGFRTGPRGAKKAAAEPRVELAEIRRMIADLGDQVRQRELSGAPEELFQSYASLVNASISASLARSIVGRIREKLPPDSLRNRALVDEAVRATVEGMIPVAAPGAPVSGRARRVMLVGPTGVGKTTTIAKLAGLASVRDGRRVALVTLDTFRIAATDQLGRIAELLEIPMKVVKTPAALTAALAGFDRADLVLIDSAGRSQRDVAKMDELAPFVAAAAPDELHLVCAATTQHDTLMDQVERFGRYPITHVILTKVDEAARFGLVLDVLARVKKGVSWVTTGQGIPNDIEPARRDRLADLILREAKRA
jgi:flagellar biosynthesis protein FlhF